VIIHKKHRKNTRSYIYCLYTYGYIYGYIYIYISSIYLSSITIP
jgi:hypothetical protein